MNDLHCVCGSGCNKRIKELEAKIAVLEKTPTYGEWALQHVEIKSLKEQIATLEDSVFQYGIENTKLQLLRDKLEAVKEQIAALLKQENTRLNAVLDTLLMGDMDYKSVQRIILESRNHE